MVAHILDLVQTFLAHGAFLTETLDSDGFSSARGMRFLTKAFGLITAEKESSVESKNSL